MRLPVPAALLVATLVACAGGDDGPSDPGSPAVTDADVSARARAASGWTYYKNRPDTLLRSAASGHVEARLRTRFNAIAATQLGADGKVRQGASFPDSSLIVKELIIGGSLSRYAVMMKLRGSSLSAGGWLWAYYAPSGAAQIGIAGRGAACVACHASGIDHVRMNDSHP